MNGAIMVRANLSGAELFGVTLANVNARGADFRNAEVTASNLSNGNFAGADFRGAELNGARLTGGSFSRADFTGASLQRTDIRGTDLSLSRGLTQSQINEACSDSSTRLPSGLTGRNCRNLSRVQPPAAPQPPAPPTRVVVAGR